MELCHPTQQIIPTLWVGDFVLLAFDHAAAVIDNIGMCAPNQFPGRMRITHVYG